METATPVRHGYPTPAEGCTGLWPCLVWEHTDSTTNRALTVRK